MKKILSLLMLLVTTWSLSVTHAVTVTFNCEDPSAIYGVYDNNIYGTQLLNENTAQTTQEITFTENLLIVVNDGFTIESLTAQNVDLDKGDHYEISKQTFYSPSEFTLPCVTLYTTYSKIEDNDVLTLTTSGGLVDNDQPDESKYENWDQDKNPIYTFSGITGLKFAVAMYTNAFEISSESNDLKVETIEGGYEVTPLNNEYTMLVIGTEDSSDSKIKSITNRLNSENLSTGAPEGYDYWFNISDYSKGMTFDVTEESKDSGDDGVKYTFIAPDCLKIKANSDDITPEYIPGTSGENGQYVVDVTSYIPLYATIYVEIDTSKEAYKDYSIKNITYPDGEITNQNGMYMISADSFSQNTTFTVNCFKYEPDCNAKFIIAYGDTSGVYYKIGNGSQQFINDNNEHEISFMSSEDTIEIGNLATRQLFKVTVGDKEFTTFNNGILTLNPRDEGYPEEGSLISVYVSDPDAGVPVAISIQDDLKEVVKSVKIGSFEVQDWENGFKIPEGNTFGISLWTKAYNIKSFMVNDTDEKNAIDAGDYIIRNVKSEDYPEGITITISAETKPNLTLNFEITDPSTVKVTDNNENVLSLTGQDGEYTASVSAKTEKIVIVGTEDYYIDEMHYTREGDDYNNENGGFIGYSGSAIDIYDKMNVKIVTKERRPDSFVVYVDVEGATLNMPQEQIYKTTTPDLNEPDRTESEEVVGGELKAANISLIQGYNTIKFNSEFEKKISVSVQNGTAYLYADNARINDLSDLSDGSLIFVYNSEAEVYDVAYEIDSDVNVKVTHHQSVEISNPTTYSLMNGSEIWIESVKDIAGISLLKDAANDIKVSVNGVQIEANEDGIYVHNVRANSTITITKAIPVLVSIDLGTNDPASISKVEVNDEEVADWVSFYAEKDDQLTITFNIAKYEVNNLVVNGEASQIANDGTFTIKVPENGVSISFVATTGVDAINAVNLNEAEIFNLHGMKVDTNKLTKGIYIINGKKVLVK